MSFISDIKNVSAKVGNIVKKTYGPLAPLNGHTNYTWSNLRYPLDVGRPELYPHTVEFQCWLPTPTGLTDVTSQTRSDYPFQKTSAGDRYGKLAQRNTPTTMKINENVNKNSRITDFTRRAEISDLIALYLPQGAWNDRINNDYQTQSVTEALGTTAGLATEVITGLSDAWKEGRSLLKSVTAPGVEVGAAVVSNLLGGDTNAMRNIGLAALGYAINPQFEVVYNATQMREFQFDFTLTPRNKDEAESCISIIQAFKYHASPEYTGTGSGRYVIPPSYFDIEFKYMGSRNENLPKISTCVLNSFDVNYSGGLEQWGSYVDGMPIQIQMVLNFIELEVMHKRLRTEGY